MGALRGYRETPYPSHPARSLCPSCSAQSPVSASSHSTREHRVTFPRGPGRLHRGVSASDLPWGVPADGADGHGGLCPPAATDTHHHPGGGNGPRLGRGMTEGLGEPVTSVSSLPVSLAPGNGHLMAEVCPRDAGQGCEPQRASGLNGERARGWGSWVQPWAHAVRPWVPVSTSRRRGRRRTPRFLWGATLLAQVGRG